jgi:4-diphosphocytidyl-2-C-methyl-D-erythritol kinase
LTLRSSEIASAKLNLALHVRGRLPDGRHAIETVFAFCTDGDRLACENLGEERSGTAIVETSGQFNAEVGPFNLVMSAWDAMKEAAALETGVRFTLEKSLPVAAGLGGGSADAAAALRLITSVYSLDPAIAQRVAPTLGSDVLACLLSLPMRGEAGGDVLTPIDLSGVSGTPVLLVNPRVPLPTAEVFARWDGVDRGPLGDWREGRNDLEAPAMTLVPQVEAVLSWLNLQPGADFVRMSGSGATCFAFFEDQHARDQAALAVPREWWRLATFLR